MVVSWPAGTTETSLGAAEHLTAQEAPCLMSRHQVGTAVDWVAFPLQTVLGSSIHEQSALVGRTDNISCVAVSDY